MLKGDRATPSLILFSRVERSWKCKNILCGRECTVPLSDGRTTCVKSGNFNIGSVDMISFTFFVICPGSHPNHSAHYILNLSIVSNVPIFLLFSGWTCHKSLSNQSDLSTLFQLWAFCTFNIFPTFLGFVPNPHTKFEVSGFTHCRDIEGVPKCKSGSRDLDHAPFLPEI